MANNKPQPNDSVRLSEYQTTAQPKAYAGGVPVFCAHDAIVPLKDLRPNPRNPNTHPPEQIKALGAIIRATGWRGPITVSTLSGLVVKGHGRMMAAELEDMTEVPVDYQNYASEAEELADLTADNRIAELAVVDNKLLADIFVDIDTGEIPFMLSGYTEEEYGEIVTALSEAIHDQDLMDEDDLVEPSAKPFSQYGDVWTLGKHRLMCGDSTVVEDVEKLMDGESANMLLTDPPYNVDYEGKTKDKLKIENDSMEDSKFRAFLRDAFYAADCVMEPGAAFYIWHADSEGYNFRGACHDIGWKVRQCLIWNKNSMVMGRQDYQWKHEPCLYGWKEGAAHVWESDRKQTTVLDFDRPTKSDIHPTMKPVALFDYQIQNNTKRGDLVLDLFAGSGTTIIACEQSGRTAYCMELGPGYCDAIVKRYVRTTGKKDISCVRQGQELPPEVIAELFEADAEGGEQE
ncbi:MAG: site-specific DNA-methyltransferase [Oscillospiraceae bacterium]|nr:site-specific DNA-methyltransferase [Oscillospiraceae bacterium]